MASAHLPAFVPRDRRIRRARLLPPASPQSGGMRDIMLIYEGKAWKPGVPPLCCLCR